MKSQDIQTTLITECEKMGLSVGKHPSGAVIVGARGATRLIFPEAGGWVVKEKMSYSRTKLVGAYPYEDLDKLIADVQDWARQHPFKH